MGGKDLRPVDELVDKALKAIEGGGAGKNLSLKAMNKLVWSAKQVGL